MKNVRLWLHLVGLLIGLMGSNSDVIVFLELLLRLSEHTVNNLFTAVIEADILQQIKRRTNIFLNKSFKALSRESFNGREYNQTGSYRLLYHFMSSVLDGNKWNGNVQVYDSF